MQAIKTRWLGATGNRGARIVAECFGGKVVVARKYELEPEENEQLAVQTLIEKLGWPYTTDNMIQGSGMNGETYWVFK